MPRPALSASRSIEIIDFLAAFPERAFTLSEIARAAKINMPSCRAVLGALVRSGYLTQGSKERTYVLGPGLIAAGQAALKSQPLVSRAQEAAQALFSQLKIPVLLTALVDDEIVVLESIADASGRSPGMRAGERRPFVPPVGPQFVAWSSEATIETWFARRAAHSKITPEDCRRGLALIRKRGFHVTLGSPGGSELASILADMASRREVQEYKDQMLNLMKSSDRQEPESILANELYEVVLIAAPIFNQNGEAAFSLCLGGFSEGVTGSMIEKYADHLVRACLSVMGTDLSLRARITG
jgi:DNA-binding IclR family transcriptional regulator